MDVAIDSSMSPFWTPIRDANDVANKCFRLARRVGNGNA
jgi:hypothetical protein